MTAPEIRIDPAIYDWWASRPDCGCIDGRCPDCRHEQENS